MLISLLILSSWLFIGVFPLRLTAKEVRFIETRYPHAAGYKMKTMKVVVFLISLLTTPALFVVAIFDLYDPNRIYNLVICFFILLCALTEALFLNRGNGKHRVLPLALAAMNFASFLTLFGMVFMLSRTGIVVSILSAYSNLIVEFALLLASVNIALFMKQLLIKLSFSFGTDKLLYHLLFIGVNAFYVGLYLILSRSLDCYADIDWLMVALFFVLNGTALAFSFAFGLAYFRKKK